MDLSIQWDVHIQSYILYIYWIYTIQCTILPWTVYLSKYLIKAHSTSLNLPSLPGIIMVKNRRTLPYSIFNLLAGRSKGSLSTGRKKIMFLTLRFWNWWLENGKHRIFCTPRARGCFISKVLKTWTAASVFLYFFRICCKYWCCCLALSSLSYTSKPCPQLRMVRVQSLTMHASLAGLH